MVNPDEQAVVEKSDAEAVPEPEGNDAQDLDTLLAQYDRESLPEREQQTPQDTPPDDRLAAYERRLADLERQQKQARSEAEVAEVVRRVKGDMPVDDVLVEAYMEAEAKRDPRLVKAFTMRFQNPKQWKEIEAGLQRKLKASFGSLDQGQTDTRNAVEAAVRSASTRTPEPEAPPNFRAMTDSELAEYKRRL